MSSSREKMSLHKPREVQATRQFDKCNRKILYVEDDELMSSRLVGCAAFFLLKIRALVLQALPSRPPAISSRTGSK
jgi:hypothetical protein